MDSTDEKIFKKQQMIREAEAREQAKRELNNQYQTK
jgi:hypothetical protein